MTVRNLTLTLPTDLVRQAKVIAAKRDTSVSALVAEYLRRLADHDEDYDRLWQREVQMMRQGLRMRVGEITWARDATHER